MAVSQNIVDHNLHVKAELVVTRNAQLMPCSDTAR